MSLSVVHAFVNGHADGSDATLVQPSNWNAAHKLAGATIGDLMVAASSSTIGAIAAVALGQVLVSQGTGTLPAWSSTLALNGATPPAGMELYVVSTSASDPRGIMLAQYSTDTNGARIHFRKGRGSEAAPTVVVSGDTLGRMRFSGYDGSTYLQMASIDAIATGTIAATRVPTYLSFSVATDAAPSVLTERMRLNPDGTVAFTVKPGSLGGGGIGVAITEDPVGNPVGQNGYIRLGRGQAVVTRNRLNTGDHLLLSSNAGLTDDTQVGDGDYILSLLGISVFLPGVPGSSTPNEGQLKFTNNSGLHPMLAAQGSTLRVLTVDGSGNGFAPFAAQNITANGNLIATLCQTMTALIATGGATPPAFANGIGGVGQPTTAAQNGWMKALDSTGATVWIPVWK